jgi:hypothetical protein
VQARLETESWQSPASLRFGAPSRVRSEASPAPPPLTDAVASAEGQLSGSLSSRGNRHFTIQPTNPGGFHISGKALTIMNTGSSEGRGPDRTQNRVPSRVEGPNIIYGVSKAAPTAEMLKGTSVNIELWMQYRE